MSQSFDFTKLPDDLRRYLLLGFSGRPHLHSAANVALGHSRQPGDICSTIAYDLLLSAWGENPFDGTCAAVLGGAMDKLPPLPATLIPVIKGVLNHWQPEVTADAQAAMAGDKPEQLAYLKDRLNQTPQSIFWWHHLYEFSRIHGDWSEMVEMLGTATPPDGLAPLFAYALANALLVSGEHLPAAGTYRHCLETLPFPIIEERLATAWLRSGKLDKGTELLRQCADKRPWNVGLSLRSYELSAGGATATPTLPGRTMVLGYSWNKADDLAETLDSLAKSELDNVQVRILDNGSTDRTPEVIRQFVDKFGSDKAAAVTMPINIGAPAARNWLMSLSEVKDSDYAAFIDDDISLPTDWLTRLGAAAERYPDAGVWGCKVVDYGGPARVQCGEHNLTPSRDDRRETLLSTIMLQDADFGQADYIRPCASVTGCVHLFKTERLLENGGFDVRFSPSQYDDLERDLRMVLGGGHAVYTGFLGIPHKRKSGSMSEAGKPESAGATANLFKLMGKYSDGEFEAMAQNLDDILLADLLKKT